MSSIYNLFYINKNIQKLFSELQIYINFLSEINYISLKCMSETKKSSQSFNLCFVLKGRN